MSGLRHRAQRTVKAQLFKRGVAIERLSAEDRRYREALVDPTTPLPAGADSRLSADHPRLAELRDRYRNVDDAVRVHSRWRDERINPWLDLRYFRGDNAYIWHYRESLRITELKFLLYAQDVRRRDDPDLLGKLEEDGAFGCWTYEFEGLPTLSRDLLDSVNEMLFLDRHLGVLGGNVPRVLDIGAGYGRMAHRFITACADVKDYSCVDAVAESTFLSEYYVEARGLVPPGRVIPLDEVDSLETGAYDLAINIHSWSECTLDAIRWWIGRIRDLEIPRIFLIPNERQGFQSTEVDGSRCDYLPVIEDAGYALTVDELALPSPAVRAALDLHDRHCLFERQR